MIFHETTSAVIEKDSQYLLIKRGVKPHKGAWAVPGGHVDEGESPKEAMMRECEEEIGCKVKIKKKLFVIVHDVGLGHKHRAHIFLVELLGKPKAGSDASALGWFSPAQMAKLDLAVYTTDIFNKFLPKRILDKVSRPHEKRI